MHHNIIHKLPLFSVSVICDEEWVLGLSFNKSGNTTKFKSALPGKIQEALSSYFLGERRDFSLPLLIEGTPFQKAVWKSISKILYGERATYGDIAREIKQDQAYRAVANSCGANRFPIFIPCHRVVSANSLGGFSSDIRIKGFLLKLELGVSGD